jgi:hypothetical protein
MKKIRHSENSRKINETRKKNLQKFKFFIEFWVGEIDKKKMETSGNDNKQKSGKLSQFVILNRM